MKKLELANVEEMIDGNFNRPKAGGYVAVIVGVEDVPEKEYLKISYDIADGEFKKFYTNRKKEKGYDYPFFFRSYKDSALGFFKGFVTSVEKSNAGFKWDGCTESQFVKKGVGIVLGEEHYLNNEGKEKVRYTVASTHSVAAIRKGDFEIPPVKEVEKSNFAPNSDNPFTNNVAETEASSDGESFFDSVGDDDECPF